LGTNGVGGPVTVRSLQIEVMRFADNYAAVVAHAADDLNEMSTDPEKRRITAKWKLDQATVAFINASGPNPIINALDMVVLATASRIVVEGGLVGSAEPVLAFLDTHRKLETNAWALVSNVLSPEQRGELRELILEWRRNNPRQRDVTGLRFREFLSALGKTPQRESSTPSSLFGLLFLDPMASMDPATAAIEETRNTAERAMYYTQRLPTLLTWQMQLLTYELVLQPEAKQLLSDTDRFAKSAEIFARTAEQMPKVINEQREAAIKQFFEGAAPEEKKAKELLAAAREVVVEARETLKAGSTAADSVKTAVTALDSFVQGVSKTNTTATATNHRPYDVLDYATTAREISVAAKDLTTLLASANESSARLAKARQDTVTEAKVVLNYAYGRALTLIVTLVIGGFVAAVAYRLFTRRLERWQTSERAVRSQAACVTHEKL
jgi:hypothetical protein